MPPQLRLTSIGIVRMKLATLRHRSRWTSLPLTTTSISLNARPKPNSPRTRSNSRRHHPNRSKRPSRVKGGAPRIEPSWQTALVRHLQQYKRYPSDAQSRGEDGVVMLSFTVDRTGHVLARQIARSSGHRELDNEVMSMIERAQPLPPFPATMPQATLDLTVPIRFSLR